MIPALTIKLGWLEISAADPLSVIVAGFVALAYIAFRSRTQRGR